MSEVASERPTDARSLCEYLVKRLVDEPDAVSVTEEPADDGVVLVVHLAAEDRGKVIGKGGRVVRALRTVVRTAGVKNGTRILVEIEE